MATDVSATPTGLVAAGLRRRAFDIRGSAFKLLLLAAVAGSMIILGALIYEMIAEGRSVLASRLSGFVTTGLKSNPELAGVWQGIRGTISIGVIVAAVAFPLGVGAAVYLEEYAEDGRFARTVNVNIRNLAGVPSIVYGLLGLAIFVQALGFNFGFDPLAGIGIGIEGGGITGGRTVIAGGLTLAVLVLPIIIITAQEALRAVPAGLREGAYALGATRWEVIRTTVVPAAAPGILTGTVLALARAAGEAAPLLVVGAVSGVFFAGGQDLAVQIADGRFTALPMVIFAWARLPAGQGWGPLVAAASLILLGLVVLMNGFAIYLRNRFERRW